MSLSAGLTPWEDLTLKNQLPLIKVRVYVWLVLGLDIPHTVIILVSLVDVNMKRTVVNIIEDAIPIGVLIAVVVL